MSRMIRPRLFTPGFLIVILVVLVIIVITGLIFWNMYFKGPEPVVSGQNENPTQIVHQEEQNQNGNDSNNSNTPTNIQYPVSKYEGLWADLVNGSLENNGADLWIYDNKDGTISFDFLTASMGEQKSTNIQIDSNGIGDFQTNGGLSGKIILKDSVVDLEYSGRTISFSIASSRIVSRRQIFDEIDSIISSNYSQIDKTIFDYDETDNYMQLRLASGCIIKHDEVQVSYEGKDFIRDVYIIDKKQGKLITIQDLLENNSQRIQAVDKYIKGYIEIKKMEFARLGELNESYKDMPWPYKNFAGILDPYNYDSKYFEIDEVNKNVLIKALPYPDKANRALGDIWVAVPFEIVYDEARQAEFGVTTKTFNPMIKKEIAMAYLKFIISRQTGTNLVDFGQEDTDYYNLIYFERPELAIVDVNFEYKKYSYNENLEITESSDYNEEYTSIREKKYSPLEIKQVFCLSSDLAS